MGVLVVFSGGGVPAGLMHRRKDCRHRVVTSLCLLAALVFPSCFAKADAVTGQLLNGEFSLAGLPPEPFSQWTTDLLIGDRPSNGGGVATFEVAGVSDVKQLEQAFSLPVEPSMIMFELRVETIGSPSPSAVRDSFQATLYDASFNPLLPQDPFAPSFFTIDNNGAKFFNPAFVSVVSLGGGVERVQFNISSLSTQPAILEFLLLGNNDQLTTLAHLDNVAVSAIPESGAVSLVVWGISLLIGFGRFGRATPSIVRLRTAS